MKIIAFYLPQFHEIPENNEWWGKGFTEWTNVKSAKPLFPGHQQPKIPFENNYYDLTNDDVKIWQAKIAKKYGIYGFCYYHYWFNGKLLLEKPMEQMLQNKKVDIPFCICWANEAWTKQWVGNEKTILIQQKYGDKNEWKKHFEYFVPFFKDQRYICKNGKPLIFIYRPDIIPCLNEMISLWRELAIQYGFKGLTVLGKRSGSAMEDDNKYKSFDYIVEWQPSCVKDVSHKTRNPIKLVRRAVYDKLSLLFHKDMYRYSILEYFIRRKRKNMGSYDSVWEDIINMKPISKKSIPGAFVRWDNTPRFGEKGTIIKGETPEKFGYYMSKQIDHAKNIYKKNFMFLFAWNEWAEGGFLEPDMINQYRYLEALKISLGKKDDSR